MKKRKTPVLIDEDRRAVLRALQDHLRMFGDANDAEDHGFPDVAEQERKDARASIQDLITQHGFLADQIPTLQKELDSPRLLTFGWAELFDKINALLQMSPPTMSFTA